MPHIVVEHTNMPDINMSDFLYDLHISLSQQDTVKIEAIKTRGVLTHDAHVGAPSQENDFIHITLKLLPGRPDALKKQMAEGLYKIAKAHAINYPNASISVETTELHQASYIK